MKLRFLSLFLIATALYSCNSKPEEKVATPVVKTAKPILPPINISGTSYFFAPSFNEKECEAVGECDCCTSIVLFIDSENFITICPCESEESILRGTYKIKDNKVVLLYDTLKIDRDYNFDYDTDTIKTAQPEYTINIVKADAATEVLLPKYCKGKLYFETGTSNEKSYGTIDAKYSLKERIQMLKDEGVWDKINE